jgi:hypothetical protein
VRQDLAEGVVGEGKLHRTPRQATNCAFDGRPNDRAAGHFTSHKTAVNFITHGLMEFILAWLSALIS